MLYYNIITITIIFNRAKVVIFPIWQIGIASFLMFKKRSLYSKFLKKAKNIVVSKFSRSSLNQPRDNYRHLSFWVRCRFSL